MKNLRRFLISVFLFWTFKASGSFASVYISEVAWMGTTESANAEWIEIYNNGSESVNLNGWKLYEQSGSVLVFTLTKEVNPGGYLIIERTTPSVPDPLPSISDEQGQFGGSGLSNNGEYLTLKDSSGTIVDELPFSSGWPAGDSESRQTMQYIGNSWVTGSPTPKSGALSSLPEQEENENQTSTQEPESRNSNPRIVLEDPRIKITHPSYFVVGIPEAIKAVVEIPPLGTTKVGYFIWSSGDGYTKESKNLEPFKYTFQYPGNYVVTLAYFKSEKQKDFEPEAIAHFTANVISADIFIERVNNQLINVVNKSKQKVDLHNWVVKSSTESFVFPKYTYLLENMTLPIHSSKLGIMYFADDPILINSQGVVVGVIKDKTNINKPTTAPSLNQKVLGASSRGLDNLDSDLEEQKVLGKKEDESKKRTLAVIALGALIAISIGLFLLLERFKVPEE